MKLIKIAFIVELIIAIIMSVIMFFQSLQNFNEFDFLSRYDISIISYKNSILFDSISIPVAGMLSLLTLFFLWKKIYYKFYFWSLILFGLLGTITFFILNKFFFEIPIIQTKYDFTLIIFSYGFLLKIIADKEIQPH